MANSGLNQDIDNQKVEFPLQYGAINDVFKLE